MKISDDLPNTRTRKIDWAEMRALAEANPGKWIESPISVSPSTATQIKRGRFKSIDPEGLHISSRRDSENPKRSFIYIKVEQ